MGPGALREAAGEPAMDQGRGERAATRCLRPSGRRLRGIEKANADIEAVDELIRKLGFNEFPQAEIAKAAYFKQ